MKLLFVCNQNKNTSKTAEGLFRGRFETKSAGLYNASPLLKAELVWADVVVVMEDAQRKEIANRFPDMYLQKKIISLEIQDIYAYDNSDLKLLLEKKLVEALG